jgi:hypothetical protein
MIKMKKIILAAFLSTSLTIQMSGQIKYEKGYYLDKEGKKYEGLVLNKDWRDNPDHFNFKATEEAASQRISIYEVTEFGIGQSKKFVRAKVKLDAKVKSYQRGPQWESVDIFLSVVIQSSTVTLYRWSRDNVHRYFFSIDSKTPEQLVYKKYILANEKNVHQFFEAVNNDYLFQLNQNVNCGTPENAKPQYSYKSLRKYFTDFIQCRQLTIEFEEENERKPKLSIALQLGLELKSYRANQEYFFTNYDYRFSGKSIRIGFEAELNLPFNNGKWSLVCAPSYKSFEGKPQVIAGNSANIKSKSIEFPIGLSHNFLFSQDIKSFLRGYIVQDFSFNSKFSSEISGPVIDLRIRANPNFAFGGGFNFRGVSVEARYYIPKKFLRGTVWNSEYQSFAFFVSYKILK